MCPVCKGPLAGGEAAYACPSCARAYPIVAGIPDFRIHPDPYIGLEADREKGARLDAAASEGRGFEEMVRYYYSITPDHPADLARRRVRHAMAEAGIAAAVLAQTGAWPGRPVRALLDVGCSTGGLLVAARERAATLVGVDVAFRWLTVGRLRLREAGVTAFLVCANAEALPFEAGSFDYVTATDLLEHARDAAASVREAGRVLSGGGETLWTTNNRWAPLPEPHVGLFGVGWLPRRWQKGYVARRRADLREYEVSLKSVREIRRFFRAAGFSRIAVAPAPLVAPGRTRAAGALALYNRLRLAPVFSTAARWFGPRLAVRAWKDAAGMSQ
ncbi:MAG TPA: methyltransferase domain-containing protein [Vicinamibacterales bacterium]|nr:methyltransferase domain-containing protein [Vicinamibacterales bacterium]